MRTAAARGVVRLRRGLLETRRPGRERPEAQTSLGGDGDPRASSLPSHPLAACASATATVAPRVQRHPPPRERERARECKLLDCLPPPSPRHLRPPPPSRASPLTPTSPPAGPSQRVGAEGSAREGVACRARARARVTTRRPIRIRMPASPCTAAHPTATGTRGRVREKWYRIVFILFVGLMVCGSVARRPRACGCRAARNARAKKDTNQPKVRGGRGGDGRGDSGKVRVAKSARAPLRARAARRSCRARRSRATPRAAPAEGHGLASASHPPPRPARARTAPATGGRLARGARGLAARGWALGLLPLGRGRGGRA